MSSKLKTVVLFLLSLSLSLSMGTVNGDKPTDQQPPTASFAEACSAAVGAALQEGADTCEGVVDSAVGTLKSIAEPLKSIAESPMRLSSLASMDEPGQPSDKSPRQGSRYDPLNQALWGFLPPILFMEALKGNPNSRNLQAITGYGASLSIEGREPHLTANALAAMKQYASAIKFYGKHIYLGSGQPLILSEIESPMAQLMNKFTSEYIECKYELFYLYQQETVVVMLFRSDKSKNLKAIAMLAEKNSDATLIKDQGQKAFWTEACRKGDLLTLKPDDKLVQGTWHRIINMTEGSDITALWPQYDLDKLNLKPEARSASKPESRNSRSPTPTRQISDPSGMLRQISDPSGMPRQISDPSGMPRQISDPSGMPRQISDPSGIFKSGTAFPMLRENSSGSVTPPLVQHTPPTTPPTTPRKNIISRLISASPIRSKAVNQSQGQPIMDGDEASEQGLGSHVVNHEYLASFGGDAIGVEPTDGSEA